MGFSEADPGDPAGENTLLTDPEYEWPEHWSKSHASYQRIDPGWVIGTDGSLVAESVHRDDYGFIWALGDRPGGSWGDTLADGLVEVRIRNLASREARVWNVADNHWDSLGPAPYDPSEQSDGWFRFRVRVNAQNYPTNCPNLGPCIPFRLNMGNTGHGTNRYFTEGGYDWAVFRPLYRTVTCSGSSCAYGDWSRAEYVYTYPYERRPEVIFAVPVDPAECPAATGCFIEVAQMLPYTKLDRDAFVDEVEQFCANTVHCKVYRGGAKPWTTSAPAEAGLANLPPHHGAEEDNDFVFIEFAPFNLDQPPAEELRPDGVILITAGVHYEPDGMFAVEGIVRELMASIPQNPSVPNLLFGDGTGAPGGGDPEIPGPISYAIVLGASPDNLSWATTHVAPRGDGRSLRERLDAECSWRWVWSGNPLDPALWQQSSPQVHIPDEFLWNTGLWAFDVSVNPLWPLRGDEGYGEYLLTPPCSDNEPLCYVDPEGEFMEPAGRDFSAGCVLRHNDDPESVALRHYFVSLAAAKEPRARLGHMVVLHLDLHGDIAPHPDSWYIDENVPTRLPPPYGIWSYNGLAGSDPVTFGHFEDKVEEFAANLRDEDKGYHTPLKRYFRPFDQWWGSRSQFWANEAGAELYRAAHDFTRSMPLSFSHVPAQPISAFALFQIVIEMDEAALYRNSGDLYPFSEGLPPEVPDGSIEECEPGEEIESPEGDPYFYSFCVDGTIDTPWIYEQWGRSIVWAARDAFALSCYEVFDSVARQYYCNADGDNHYPKSVSCEDDDPCPSTDCITWPGEDCDDSDPAVGPGGIEVCDAVDNDCNGVTDDEDEVCGLEICYLRKVCSGAGGCVAASDSDGDGLADVDEATWFGSPNNPDTDGDGLQDGAEVCLANGGLCPKVNAADSDGDTLGDAAEAQLGTNLCEPDTDDDRLGDAEDPTPTDPGAPRAYLEAECRALGDFISSISYTLFYGATTLEKKGKRTMLASYAYTAANKLASNLNDPQAAAKAEEQLLALQLYVDGAGQPDDWMVPSSEKTAVYDETDLLLYLLAYL